MRKSRSGLDSDAVFPRQAARESVRSCEGVAIVWGVVVEEGEEEEGLRVEEEEEGEEGGKEEGNEEEEEIKDVVHNPPVKVSSGAAMPFWVNAHRPRRRKGRDRRRLRV
ncbi:hypothetical protein OCU04_005141 [Sclerotinia nivalis]|uniref:Uncharacterized protein n=1 Tax=Sclerotinia nivalis TaxID=352851 RepID=A0A9X0DKA0_9HELO|nr:hypothetical protein OCU04_005141 [Sclerotinia nivalis]